MFSYTWKLSNNKYKNMNRSVENKTPGYFYYTVYVIILDCFFISIIFTLRKKNLKNKRNFISEFKNFLQELFF